MAARNVATKPPGKPPAFELRVAPALTLTDKEYQEMRNASIAVLREIGVDTPFGAPSDNFIIGTLEGVRVAFLARHGRGHRILPTELNFRANIYAMKLLGVERILSASAVGSMRDTPRSFAVFRI